MGEIALVRVPCWGVACISPPADAAPQSATRKPLRAPKLCGELPETGYNDACSRTCVVFAPSAQLLPTSRLRLNNGPYAPHHHPAPSYTNLSYDIPLPKTRAAFALGLLTPCAAPPLSRSSAKPIHWPHARSNHVGNGPRCLAAWPLSLVYPGHERLCAREIVAHAAHVLPPLHKVK